MIIKGGSHSGRGLGIYLLQDKNERVEVWGVRGDIQRPIPDLINDWRSDAFGTDCQKPLYHAQLNPNRPLTREEWNTAIDLFEQEMGFTQQPRLAVLHEYKGREHVHLVYSRLDEDGKAISDSWNYFHHEKSARAIEQNLGLEATQGVLYGRKGGNRPERTPSQAAIQQGERTQYSPQAVKAQVSSLYQHNHSDAQAFVAALNGQGYRLAQGDKRGLVVLDAAGGVHSLSRVSGAKAGELRELFKSYGELPSVSAVKAKPPVEPSHSPPFSHSNSVSEDPILKRHKRQIQQSGAVHHHGLVGKWHEQQAEWQHEHQMAIADPFRRTINPLDQDQTLER